MMTAYLIPAALAVVVGCLGVRLWRKNREADVQLAYYLAQREALDECPGHCEFPGDFHDEPFCCDVCERLACGVCGTSNGTNWLSPDDKTEDDELAEGEHRYEEMVG